MIIWRWRRNQFSLRLLLLLISRRGRFFHGLLFSSYESLPGTRKSSMGFITQLHCTTLRLLLCECFVFWIYLVLTLTCFSTLCKVNTLPFLRPSWSFFKKSEVCVAPTPSALNLSIGKYAPYGIPSQTIAKTSIVITINILVGCWRHCLLSKTILPMDSIYS